jgi:hypothetical protein
VRLMKAEVLTGLTVALKTMRKKYSFGRMVGTPDWRFRCRDCLLKVNIVFSCVFIRYCSSTPSELESIVLRYI